MKSTSTTHLNKIFCIVGPSGTGKSALTKEIPLPSVVSYRTREPRIGEIDGIDGHFITKQKFLDMKQQKLWIAETDYADNYYGITQGELLELEDSPMLYVIDWEGVETLKTALDALEDYSSDQIVSIFIHTPRTDLESRMLKNGRSKEEIRARIDRADRDYAASSRCDYVVENRNGEFIHTQVEVLKIIAKESWK